MTYYLQHSDWLDTPTMPEGMNLDMLNMAPARLEKLLKPALKQNAPNSIVVDLGAGTGILGMYALENGADFVYFVDIDPQMSYILSNVLPKKIDSTKFKIINKDIESLCLDDFVYGLPNVVVSEFYGPRLFDEGYVNYTKHLRSFLPNCYFIPETFEVEFYLSEIDYTQPIWPKEPMLIDHFKFMYRQKCFAKHIEFVDGNYVGSILFNANNQTFSNKVEFLYNETSEKLLIGRAVVKHGDLEQYYTSMGWLLTEEDCGKKICVYYDDTNYFNPKKIVVPDAK